MHPTSELKRRNLKSFGNDTVLYTSAKKFSRRSGTWISMTKLHAVAYTTCHRHIAVRGQGVIGGGEACPPATKLSCFQFSFQTVTLLIIIIISIALKTVASWPDLPLAFTSLNFETESAFEEGPTGITQELSHAYSLASPWTSYWSWLMLWQALNAANRPRVTDEPVEVHQDFRKTTHNFREVDRICFKLITKNRKITTCSWLDLETRGFWLINYPPTLPTSCRTWNRNKQKGRNCSKSTVTHVTCQ